jgi:hypothetical protein
MNAGSFQNLTRHVEMEIVCNVQNSPAIKNLQVVVSQVNAVVIHQIQTLQL